MTTLIRLAEAWWPLYAVHLLQLSLFIFLVWAVDRWAKLDTRLRYYLWMVALVKTFIPPFYALPLPVFLTSAPVSDPMSFGGPAVLSNPWGTSEVAAIHPAPWAVWGFGLWALSVLVFAGGTVWRNARFQQSLNEASPVDLPDELAGLQGVGALRVYAKEDLRSPVLVGVLRPRLYLPAQWSTWTPTQLRGVVAHELAHLHSRDIWVLAFQALATALFWLNPLVWLVNRRLSEIRELRCDEVALELSGVSPVAYGKLLIHFLDGRSRPVLSAMYFTEQGTPLQKRVEHVLNFKEGDIRHTGWHRLVPILVGLAILPLSIRETYSQVQGANAGAAEKSLAVDVENLQKGQIWINSKGQLMLDLYAISLQDLKVQLEWLKHTKKIQAVVLKVDAAAPKDVLEQVRQSAESKGLSVSVQAPSPISGMVDPLQRFERFFSDGGFVPAKDGIGAMELAEVEVKPEPISMVPPVYPEEARSENRNGNVFVRFRVNLDGSVSDAQVLKGAEVFRQAAVDAVLQSRFKPAAHHGEPVAVWMVMPVAFSLKGTGRTSGEKPSVCTVMVNAKGHVLVGMEKVVPIEGLRAEIERRHRANPKLTVNLEADPEVLPGDLQKVEAQLKIKGLIVQIPNALAPKLYGGTSEPGSPEKFTLDQNFPNPFNPETLISYQLAVPVSVTLKVYTVTGQEVRTLVSESQQPGRYNVRWDGKDGRGNAVASGIYVYELQAGDFRESRQMKLVK